jgi:hypothetical protein
MNERLNIDVYKKRKPKLSVSNSTLLSVSVRGNSLDESELIHLMRLFNHLNREREREREKIDDVNIIKEN